jgi:signal transduction histidine kinase/CheY-like chemotaxis protein
MTELSGAFAELTSASREFLFASDARGAILEADPRAAALVGLAAGHRLAAAIAEGSEAKLEQLLARAVDEPVASWELALSVDKRAVTVALATRPHAGGFVALGSVIPEAFSAAMTQVGEMVSEVTDLNRTVRHQRDEATERAAELERLNTALSESNRGILALHAELQSTAEQTRQEAEIKARLVANLSHELRTPLHSILGLANLLTSGADGQLAVEQAKQVRYIKTAADELLVLVNDVLDLGRLEAGHAQLRVETFELGDFLGSMRGVLRPLIAPGSPVQLVIEDPADEIRLDTDRTRLSQIVRNLVSNAIKFTERGEVRVAAQLADGLLELTVADTGIGIAEEDRAKIFEEYGQIDSELQRRLKGSGLGLPLARRLAHSLGGTLTVDSELGQGSKFTLRIPPRHDQAALVQDIVERSKQRASDATSILVVEDDPNTLFLYEKYLVMAGFHVLPARTIDQASQLLAEQRPAAIVLDVMLEGDSSWGFLARIKSDPATRDIPVLVVTVTNREDKARALGADEFWLKPVDQDRLLKKLKDIANPAVARVLVIDDDETSRYIVRKHLEGTPYLLFEAETGAEGLRLARDEHPDVILLDFLLKGATAFDVLDDLKADSATRGIPVIIVTSHVLDAVDQRRLLEEAEAVISKQTLSRELAINRIRDALHKLDKAGIRRSE